MQKAEVRGKQVTDFVTFDSSIDKDPFLGIRDPSVHELRK